MLFRAARRNITRPPRRRPSSLPRRKGSLQAVDGIHESERRCRVQLTSDGSEGGVGGVLIVFPIGARVQITGWLVCVQLTCGRVFLRPLHSKLNV